MKVVASHAVESLDVLKERLDSMGYLFFPVFGRDNELLTFLAHFGSNRLQDDVRPYYIVKAGEVLQPIDGSALMPHTDDFNVSQMPPRLVALYCVNPGTGDGGETLIADGYAWLSSHMEAIELIQRKWSYKRGVALVELPFLSVTPWGEKILRVSFGHLQYTHDEQMVGVMGGLKDWFDKTAAPVCYQRGSLLISNNWRIIHGRTAYTDLNRELHRYHLD